jgi:acetylornithine deacetylase/succinyl-diaminopimelate desuccinylase-like protein
VTVAHTKDEYCEISDLTQAAELYASLARTLIG